MLIFRLFQIASRGKGKAMLCFVPATPRYSANEDNPLKKQKILPFPNEKQLFRVLLRPEIFFPRPWKYLIFLPSLCKKYSIFLICFATFNRFCRYPEILSRMSEIAQKIAKPHATLDIAKLALKQ